MDQLLLDSVVVEVYYYYYYFAYSLPKLQLLPKVVTTMMKELLQLQLLELEMLV